MAKRSIPTTSRWWPALRLVGFCIIVAIAPGCPTLAANSARSSYIKAQAAKFEYDQTPSKVAQEAQHLVRSSGYELASGGNALAFETDWRDMPGGRQRINVRITSHTALSGADKVRVHFTKIEEQNLEGGKKTRSSEDHRMQWRLIKRVAPARAAVIQKAANKRASEAYRGCQATCHPPPQETDSP